MWTGFGRSLRSIAHMLWALKFSRLSRVPELLLAAATKSMPTNVCRLSSMHKPPLAPPVVIPGSLFFPNARRRKPRHSTYTAYHVHRSTYTANFFYLYYFLAWGGFGGARGDEPSRETVHVEALSLWRHANLQARRRTLGDRACRNIRCHSTYITAPTSYSDHSTCTASIPQHLHIFYITAPPPH